MMPVEIQSQQSTVRTGETEITPEMVKKIADLVYNFLIDELRIEKERARFSSQSEKPGGW